MTNLRSIRWRIVASMMAMTLLTVLAVGVLAQFFVVREISRREIDMLRGNAESVAMRAGELIEADRSGDALVELAEASAFLAQARVVIADGERDVLVDSGPIGGADDVVWFGAPSSMGRPVTGTVTLSEFPDIGLGPSVALHLGSVLEAGRVDLFQPLSGTIEGIGDGRITVIRRTGDEWGNVLEFETALDGMHLAEVIGEVEHIGDGLVVPPAKHIEAIVSLHNKPPSGVHVTVPVGEVSGPAGYVTLHSPPDFGASTLAATRRALGMAAVLAMAMAAVLGIVVSRGLTAPIADLTRAADGMADGDLSVRAPVTRSDELGRLGRTFNRMAGQLQTSFATLAEERDALRRFVSDASHELRTPITALTNFNELMQGPAGSDPAARDEFLAESATQLDRLSWITSNLLDLSRLEMGLKTLDMAPHDVGDLIGAAVDAHRTSADREGLDITARVPDDAVLLTCDGRHVELALGNLVDNAIKFTGAGGRAEIGARVVGDDVRFWVQDAGPGIGPEEADRVFERFYQGRAAAEVDAEGSGLGLAIVKAVAVAHGGHVWVESPDEGGCRFVIELPLAGPEVVA